MKTYTWSPIGVIKTTAKVSVFLLTIGAISSFWAGIFALKGARKTCEFCKDWWQEFRPEKEGDNY